MHTYVKVTPADDGAPAGKLADVELHFAGGELDGLRLIGFAVWARHDGAERRPSWTPEQAALLHRDEGGPLGLGLQDQGPNHRKLRRLNGWGGERLGKGGMNPSGVRWEDERE